MSKTISLNNVWIQLGKVCIHVDGEFSVTKNTFKPKKDCKFSLHRYGFGSPIATRRLQKGLEDLMDVTAEERYDRNERKYKKELRQRSQT